ncbi:MAG: EVE domain-containing protein [Verrucomicrobiales bacterium]
MPDLNNNGSRHWLIKFAPFRTSWAEIVARGSFTLRGVRSAEARKHLDAMVLGDSVLFYHSEQERAVVGVVEVAREAYPDPTSADPQWLTCDFRPVRSLPNPVPIHAIKSIAALADIPLIRQPRLSVMPLSEEQFRAICLAGGAEGRNLPSNRSANS